MGKVIFCRKDKDESVKVINSYFKYNEKHRYVAFPHRPEKEKGIYEAIEVIKELIKKDDSFRLLVPRQPDSRVADYIKESSFLLEVEKYVKKENIEEYIIFHDWISFYDLPYYYSIAEVTLFFSSLPETFGMSLINSISCGTPVISHGNGAEDAE